MSPMIPLGEAAFRIGRGVTWRHLTSLAKRGKIPFAEVGHIRAVRVADLDRIRAECERAGYLRPAEVARAS